MAISAVSQSNPVNEMERYALMQQQRAVAAKAKPVSIPPPTQPAAPAAGPSGNAGGSGAWSSQPAPATEAEKPVSTTDIALDATQLALDVTGIVDPTPISDGANTFISLFRGDFKDAAISAVSMLPAGDLVKAGRIGERLTGLVTQAADSPAARAALKPAMEKIGGLLDSAVVNKLPGPLRDMLKSIDHKVDDFLHEPVATPPQKASSPPVAGGTVSPQDARPGSGAPANEAEPESIWVRTPQGTFVEYGPHEISGRPVGGQQIEIPDSQGPHFVVGFGEDFPRASDPLVQSARADAVNHAKPQVSDRELQNRIDSLYHGAEMKDPIGNGSTADVIRWEEWRTGLPVGGTFHGDVKGPEMIRSLENWMADHPDASASDRRVAEWLLDDLKDAVDLWKRKFP